MRLQSFLISRLSISYLIAILFYTTVLPVNTSAQNLVPNPGFEEYPDPIPYGPVGVNESIGWFPLGNTTDFFHRDFNDPYGIPLNFRGYQEPASGNGYAGIYVWPFTLQEHLAVRLISPLEAGVIYQVGFKATLSDRSKYAADNLGLTFMHEDPRNLEKPIQEVVPYHFKNPDGEVISDTVAWKDLRGSYLAEGGETYLVIGNFREERRIKLEISNGSVAGVERTYFYIDDVFVQTCTDQIIEPATVFDTIICEGTTAELKGLPEADTYYWEGLDVTQNLEVGTAGAYLAHNFSRCRDVQLRYQVETADCDCSIRIPSVQATGNRLHVSADLNVQSYQLHFFDAAGRLLFQTADAALEQLQLPPYSAVYFWQADLVCLGANDIRFQKRMGGKTVVMNR